MIVTKLTKSPAIKITKSLSERRGKSFFSEINQKILRENSLKNSEKLRHVFNSVKMA